MRTQHQTETSANPAIRTSVDGFGRVEVDPTRNVLDLVAASTLRQDDLRDSSERFSSALREASERRALSEIGHVKEMAHLRADYTKQLAEAEAKRIDAIRAVDVNAVAVASERQAAAASVLANQVAQSADALRTLVATTATATAEQNRQQLAQITDRLSVVEKSQYEGRGKSQYTDPMMEQMLTEIKLLRSTQSVDTGKDEGKDKTVGYIAIVISALVGMIVVFDFLSRLMK